MSLVRTATSTVRRLVRNLGYDDGLEVGLSHRFGQVSLKEALFLKNLASTLPAGRPLIEIGTLFGKSTLALAEAKPASSQLFTVDNYSWNPLGLTSKRHRRVTAAVLAEVVNEMSVRIVDSDKDTFFENYDGPPPSMVFIDADHSYAATLRDINAARQSGAYIICGHDYSAECSDVMRAVNESGGADQLVGTLWVLPANT